MKVLCWVWAVLHLLSALHVSQVSSSKRNKGVVCSVCRSVVQEISNRISQVNPKAKFQVGGHRVDGRGHQKVAEVKYATSDVHLTEILEDVCQSFKDYVILHDDVTKRDGVVRTRSRSGQELDTSDFRTSKPGGQTLKSYCEELTGDYEDEILTLFKLDDSTIIEAQLCGHFSGACTEEELAEPAPPELPEKKRASGAAAATAGTATPLSFQVLGGPGEDGPPTGVHSLEEMKQRILDSVQSVQRCDGDGGDGGDGGGDDDGEDVVEEDVTADSGDDSDGSTFLESDDVLKDEL